MQIRKAAPSIPSSLQHSRAGCLGAPCSLLPDLSTGKEVPEDKTRACYTTRLIPLTCSFWLKLPGKSVRFCLQVFVLQLIIYSQCECYSHLGARSLDVTPLLT